MVIAPPGGLPLHEALRLRDPNPEAVLACAQALECPETDVWDVAEVLEKLREWLRRDAALAQKLLGGANVQPAVVLALKRHSANLEVARSGAGVVAGCCQRSPQNTELLVRAGAVLQIHALMDAHAGDTVAQDNACVALWRLADRCWTGAEEIVRRGGLCRLFRAMEEHARNPFVQVNACMALERLYSNGGAPPERMREAAEGAMARHPQNTQIRRGARRLLEALESSHAPLLPPLGPPVRGPARGLAAEGQRRGDGALALSFREWLLELDKVGFLMAYLGELQRSFGSLAQVVETYAPEGALDPRFFEDLGVRKLGHRRLFEK